MLIRWLNGYAVQSSQEKYHWLSLDVSIFKAGSTIYKASGFTPLQVQGLRKCVLHLEVQEKGSKGKSTGLEFVGQDSSRSPSTHQTFHDWWSSHSQLRKTSKAGQGQQQKRKGIQSVLGPALRNTKTKVPLLHGQDIFHQPEFPQHDMKQNNEGGKLCFISATV